MDSVDGKGRALAGAEGRPGGVGFARRVTILLGLGLLCLLVLLTATAAAPARGSARADLARLAIAQAELTAPDGGIADFFGTAVAISGDTALVGAYGHGSPGGLQGGAVYVFTRSGSTWTQQAELTPQVAAGWNHFGASVALAGDTALIGAPLHFRAGQADVGAAYVFVGTGSAWTQQQILTSSDAAAGDMFGLAVALSGDTALVGAPRHASGGQIDAGSAYVFTRSGGTWTQQAEVTPVGGGAHDAFGTAVALEGDAALIGAPFSNTAGTFSSGAAYVFTRSGGTWTQQALLTATDGVAEDVLGGAVSLSGDTALVGAQKHNGNFGAAFVFVRSGASWTQQAELTASDGLVADFFGQEVVLSGDTALIHAPASVSGRPETPAVYVFTRANGSWTERQKMTARVGADPGGFGWALALSGGTALIGAPFTDTLGKVNSGAAYVILLDPAPQPAPEIDKISPGSGKRGALVTISGRYFGVPQGTGVVKFGTKKCTKYVSWSDTRIKCRVPMNAKYGSVKVTVSSPTGVSGTIGFTVKH